MKLFVLLFLISTFFVLPGALGHIYLLPGCIAVFIFSMFTYLSSKKKVKLLKTNLMWFWVLVLIFTSGFFTNIKEIGVTAIYIISLQLFFSNENSARLFFKYYKFACVFICLGALINEVLLHYYTFEQLRIYTFESIANRSKFDFCLPFDLSNAFWIDADNRYSRHYLFFREPGVATVFIAPAIYMFYKDGLNKFNLLCIAILLAGIVLTKSTGIPIIIFGGVIIYRVLKNKINFKSAIGYLVLVGIGVWIFLYAPVFGYYEKMQGVYAASVEDRGNMITQGTKQAVLIFTIITTFILSKHKRDALGYKTINLLMAIGCMANFAFLLFTHLLFLFYFDTYSEATNKKL